MATPKRRILSFVFTILCFKKSLLIRIIIIIIIIIMQQWKLLFAIYN